MDFAKKSKDCRFYYNRFCCFLIRIFDPSEWNDNHLCIEENCPFMHWIKKSNKPNKPDLVGNGDCQKCGNPLRR